MTRRDATRPPTRAGRPTESPVVGGVGSWRRGSLSTLYSSALSRLKTAAASVEAVDGTNAV